MINAATSGPLAPTNRLIKLVNAEAITIPGVPMAAFGSLGPQP